jgi:hypothetical protein
VFRVFEIFDNPDLPAGLRVTERELFELHRHRKLGRAPSPPPSGTPEDPPTPDHVRNATEELRQRDLAAGIEGGVRGPTKGCVRSERARAERARARKNELGGSFFFCGRSGQNRGLEGARATRARRALLLSCSSAAGAGRIEGRERSEHEEEGAAAEAILRAALLRQERAESRVVGGRPPEPPLRPARSHMPPHSPCGRRGRTCALVLAFQRPASFVLASLAPPR